MRGARLDLAIQYATDRRGLPHRRSVERWLRASIRQRAVITVRFVGRREARAINAAYRGKNKATNVLSFDYSARPAAAPGGPRRKRGFAPNGRIRDLEFGRVPGAAMTAARPVAGDIVLCAQVVEREARAQRKPARAHFAHLVVHGALHLQGYDHRTTAQAKVMEDRERAILSSLGYPDPYGN